jgi:RNA-directed DNA polymerase
MAGKCSSQQQALQVKAAVEARLRQCKLEAHPDKTRIVYCRSGDYPHIRFDFLGYSFRPRPAKNQRNRKLFTSFLPAISDKASKAIAAQVRDWRIHRKNHLELTDLSQMFNPIIRGWISYYGKYYPTALRRNFAGLNRRLVRWARGKYKRLPDHKRQATRWLRQLARQQADLFAHWKLGIVP